MSREEANQIIKIKEERKAARLAAKNQENINSTVSSAGASPVAVGPIKSIYNKDEEASSSGNNSGNDSHEEGEKRSTSLRRTNSSVAIETTTTLIQEKTGSSAVEVPGYRELLSTRARVDNGFVSGKGQGKAL